MVHPRRKVFGFQVGHVMGRSAPDGEVDVLIGITLPSYQGWKGYQAIEAITDIQP